MIFPILADLTYNSHKKAKEYALLAVSKIDNELDILRKKLLEFSEIDRETYRGTYNEKL